MEKDEKKVTLKDIANSLNLSINTISHALRDLDDISEETKELIRNEAIRLGYKNKRYTQWIDKKDTIALVFDSFLNPYFALMGQKIVERINPKKYNLIVFRTNEFQKVDTEIIKRLIANKVDLVISFNEINSKAVDLALLNNLFLLLVGRVTNHPYVDAISTNDIKGGEIATEYLLDSGCKKLIYIYQEESEASLRRMEGFKNIVNKYNIPHLLINNNEVREKKDIILNDGYDGIFIYNDRLINQLFFEEKIIDLSQNPNIKIIGFDNCYRRSYISFPYPSLILIMMQ